MNSPIYPFQINKVTNRLYKISSRYYSCYFSLQSQISLNSLSLEESSTSLSHDFFHTSHVSFSHNFFAINRLSRLGFSFRDKLCFSFCFMGFFWVGSNNYVLKIVILLGNFLLIVILWGNNMLFMGGFRIWLLFFFLNFKVSKYYS